MAEYQAGQVSAYRQVSVPTTIDLPPRTLTFSQNGVMGPIAANLEDLQIAYRIMSIPDPLHPTSSSFPHAQRSIHQAAAQAHRNL